MPSGYARQIAEEKKNRQGRLHGLPPTGPERKMILDLSRPMYFPLMEGCHMSGQKLRGAAHVCNHHGARMSRQVCGLFGLTKHRRRSACGVSEVLSRSLARGDGAFHFEKERHTAQAPSTRLCKAQKRSPGHGNPVLLYMTLAFVNSNMKAVAEPCICTN